MNSIAEPDSSNFSFLGEHDPLYAQLGATAERAFSSDPNTTLIKLRQLGEALAQHLAAVSGITIEERATQADLLFKLNRELSLDPVVKELFHTLRVEGNKATHQFQTRHKEAMDGLKVARELAIWFHKTFGSDGPGFKPGPFIRPTDPSIQLRQRQAEIEQLKYELQQANIQLDSSQRLNDLIAQEKTEYEALATLMDDEARSLEAQTKAHQDELDKQRQAYEHKIQSLQQQLASKDDQDVSQQRKQVTQKAQVASQQLTLDEEMTRLLIDQQLIEAGWEADSQERTYKKGARPEKGVNQAIAEWPTMLNGQKGRADYVLFQGLTPLAVIEAKRENTNVAGKILQAERYSKGMAVKSPMNGAWELAGRTIAWPDEAEGHYKVPFVYSCNGRPYIPQLAESSGIWFRDIREPSNTARALPNVHSPEGLLDRLSRSKDKADLALQQEPFHYLKLRDYQVRAIQAVEDALSRELRHALLAMATGTGKTRTVTGLMYRFLKTERFKRILFLVDRRSLGNQATDTFTETPLEQNHTLATNYTIAQLDEKSAEPETRIQIATVQAMAKRVFANDTPPPVDRYDCIIVDEAHRGYTLDQEMTEGELATRDARQYLSSYRRVLDYFDAVKIGLTATPAKHTSEIFGKPIFTYSYREAVADDWLIDHEPPFRYKTLLSENGIHFAKGEVVSAIKTQTGEVETAELEDELDFDVEAFNKRVINENFNRVICEELTAQLDPFGDEKTLIFCATDLHADMVKRLLDQAFKDLYNGEYKQAAVAKITGQSDKVDQLIRQFKNERYPNIAITVDLLTTGIDVPPITHLVFLRRVRSRILYEQMIGRATRRCDTIGKTVFYIHDPVDIYATLNDVNTMKPLVKDPNVSLEQLVGELSDPETLDTALNHPGEGTDDSHADVVLSQLGQKLMRVLRKAEAKAESKPDVRAKLDELRQQWGIEPKELHTHLKQLGPHQASAFLNKHQNLLGQLNALKGLVGSEYMPILSEHEDELIGEPTQTYGPHERPGDYLDDFNRFIRDQMNQSAALAVVVNRPRDLTREQLKEVRLLLDNHGYSEANLRSAWRDQTNQDIAASVIGHIRQAALGEPLEPFEQRVSRAMDDIYRRHKWKPAQKKWLDRLAKQLVHEVVLDRVFVNDRFSDHGGAQRLNAVLDDQLDTVLEELNDSLWSPGQSG